MLGISEKLQMLRHAGCNTSVNAISHEALIRVYEHLLAQKCDPLLMKKWNSGDVFAFE